MASALGLDLVDWVKWVGVSVALELDMCRLINVMDVVFVIWDVRETVLFQLSRRSLLNVSDLHDVTPLHLLELPIRL